MAAHRFWRLLWSVQQFTRGSLAELELRTSAGGSNVATGGTAIFSSEVANNNYAGAYAFDGQTASEPNDTWASLSVNADLQVWIGYDFGVGGSQDIVEIVLKSPATFASGVATAAGHPANFAFQWSDDGAIWTTQSFVSGLTWAAAETKTVDVTPAPVYRVFPGSGSPVRWAQAPALNPVGFHARRGAITAPPGNFGRPPRATLWGGNNRIAGTTTSLSTPVRRRVDLLDQRSAEVVERRYSDAGGNYEFRDLAPGPYIVLGTDDTAEQNSVVYAHVTASPQ